MLHSISENLQDVRDSRKTIVMTNELMRLNVDIATRHETRPPDSGALTGEGLGRAQGVRTRLCSKEQSAEHD